MPYVTKSKKVTKTRTLGYDSIPIHRPKFIYFEFTGLRASVPHWVFFGSREVTNFINTSYTKENYTSAGRNSILKSPGERFVGATEFPSGGGLTYSGPTAQGGPSDPLYSNSNGVLSGVFYLQSNTSYNWNINTNGTELLALDVSAYSKEDALSVGATYFKGIGQYENYWQWSETEYYQEWVPPPRSNNDGGNDNSTTLISKRVDLGGGNYTYAYGTSTGGVATYTTMSTNTYSNSTGSLSSSVSEFGSNRVSIRSATGG